MVAELQRELDSEQESEQASEPALSLAPPTEFSQREVQTPTQQPPQVELFPPDAQIPLNYRSTAPSGP